MHTGWTNLASQMSAYERGELDESEMRLFMDDLDTDPELRAAAWHSHEEKEAA